jgi:methionyl aminopeptidase
VIIKKSPEEIEKMARAGEILVATLELLEGKVHPGVSTAELDAAAERFIRSRDIAAFPARSALRRMR